MEFVFETLYNQKGISVMAKALRKTIRKKKSIRSHIFGILIIVCAIFLSFPKNGMEFKITGNFIATWLAVIAMVIALIFEDRLNGYIAKKRMLTGMEKSVVTFKEDVYISETNLGKTEFYYNNITAIAETNEYFVFIFAPNHAQIYDKNGIIKGTIDEFKTFITQKTEKEIQQI